MALLNIFAPKLPHLFTRLFHIPAIRDITLEHLQLLSNQLLAPPLPGKAWPRPCARPGRHRPKSESGPQRGWHLVLSPQCGRPRHPRGGFKHSAFRSRG